MPKIASNSRLEARISLELHALLRQAAKLQGRTVTDFVVTAAREAAEKAIQQVQVVQLSLADQEYFANILISPLKNKQTPALKRAFANRDKLLQSEPV